MPMLSLVTMDRDPKSGGLTLLGTPGNCSLSVSTPMFFLFFFFEGSISYWQTTLQLSADLPF